jgi:hypothetical protein
VILNSNDEKKSLFNNIFEIINIKNNLTFELPLGISMINNFGFNISLITNYEINGVINSDINNLSNNSFINEFLTISKNIDLMESIILHKFTIDVSYINNNVDFTEKRYVFFF